MKPPPNMITNIEALRSYLPDVAQKLPEELLAQYPMAIPEYYLNLIDFSDENDPILRMSVPSPEELQVDGTFDTSGECQNTKYCGLQHKYSETALILSTNLCAMYCRYCFRKRLVGLDTQETVADVDTVVDYIRNHPEIHNVLISGGDSFLNSNHKIAEYLEKLCDIDHLDYIRFGTKTPIVLPQRILEDEELQKILRTYCAKKQIYISTQFNHPKELTETSVAAIHCLQDQGIIVKNQSVLLRGVNDCVHVMRKLVNGLSYLRVRPYYLYQCDLSEGIAHFRTPVSKGVEIIEGLRGHTSGYCVPTFVVDAPGGGGKIPVMPDYVITQSPERIVLRNYEGVITTYTQPVVKDSVCHCPICSDKDTNVEMIGVAGLLQGQQITLEPAKLHRKSKNDANRIYY